MSTHTDLLERVVEELRRPERVLSRVAKDTGVPYDTVLRIKNRENDPGYSRVKTLSEYLFADERAHADT